MKKSKHPFLPITRVAQGQLTEAFESSFDDRVDVRDMKHFLYDPRIIIIPFRLEATFKTKETVLFCEF